ncbi:MAG TPA: phage holin, LLH family [Patescibacteria group bacterium]|nr:phage holin, LLH family [Patescibacteria group bacterium]
MTIPDLLGTILASDAFAALVLTTVATVATAVVGWLGYAVRRHVLRRLDADELALLRQIASVAVAYAEQKYKSSDGPARLAAAMSAANTMLAAYGVKVSAEQLLAVIEAAVYAETIHFSSFTEAAPSGEVAARLGRVLPPLTEPTG